MIDGAGPRMECLTCHKIIQSKFRHDWVPCGCPNDDTRIFIDGGNAYTRVGYGPKAKYRWPDEVEVGASSEVNTEAGVYDDVP